MRKWDELPAKHRADLIEFLETCIQVVDFPERDNLGSVWPPKNTKAVRAAIALLSKPAKARRGKRTK